MKKLTLLTISVLYLAGSGLCARPAQPANKTQVTRTVEKVAPKKTNKRAQRERVPKKDGNRSQETITLGAKKRVQVATKLSEIIALTDLIEQNINSNWFRNQYAGEQGKNGIERWAIELDKAKIQGARNTQGRTTKFSGFKCNSCGYTGGKELNFNNAPGRKDPQDASDRLTMVSKGLSPNYIYGINYNRGINTTHLIDNSSYYFEIKRAAEELGPIWAKAVRGRTNRGTLGNLESIVERVQNATIQWRQWNKGVSKTFLEQYGYEWNNIGDEIIRLATLKLGKMDRDSRIGKERNRRMLSIVSFRCGSKVFPKTSDSYRQSCLAEEARAIVRLRSGKSTKADRQFVKEGLDINVDTRDAPNTYPQVYGFKVCGSVTTTRTSGTDLLEDTNASDAGLTLKKIRKRAELLQQILNLQVDSRMPEHLFPAQ